MISWVFLLAIFASSCYCEPIRDAERHRVVIVGAGVSGFAAAATLLEHNITDIILLEATDRIGGRIHTVQFGGVPLDKGAEFCHGEKDNSVYEMIGSYDLLVPYMPLIEDKASIVANTSGDVFNSTLVKKLAETALTDVMHGDDVKHFNGSFADYFKPRMDKFLQSNNVSTYLSEALHHIVPVLEQMASAAEDLSVQGAWGQSNYRECEGDLALKWKNGSRGYTTIFDFISKKIPEPSNELPIVNKTILGKEVTRVERGEKEVRVTCADGSVYLADHVIITVSLGVLKKHAVDMFYPSLPVDKSASIETLGFGCVGKVFMLFPYRWWPKDINMIIPIFSQSELHNYQNHSKHGYWTPYTSGFSPVVNHDRMLCAWHCGEACRTMESLTEEEVTDGLMELLNAVVGKTYDIPRPEGILRSTWASNPHVLGSYSYRTVVSDRQNLSNSDLAQPILDDNGKPVLLFAGEATHPHYFSTVHGAIDTGRREAHNLINYFNKQTQ